MAQKKNNHQISTVSFNEVARSIEGLLKIFASHLVYSQIWLNLPRDDCPPME
jgi:hypothetical protein